MKGKFKITNPNSTECTLKITMPLEEWKMLKDQLERRYPAWNLGSLIAELISKAQEEFEAEGNFQH